MNMSRTSAVHGCLLATALLLGACSSNQSRDDQDEKSARRAAEVNTQMGAEYLARGQYEIALEKLKRAVRSDDSYAPAHTVTAVLYERLGEDKLAETHYRQAYRASPGNGDVNNNLGAFLCRTGQVDDALEYFDRALEDPFYRTPAVAMANAGACALQQGKLDLAEDYLRKALRYDEKFPDALLSMALLNFTRADMMRTRAFLQRYEATGSKSAEALMLGYRLDSSEGDLRGAKAYQDELLKRYPGSAEAQELVQRGLR